MNDTIIMRYPVLMEDEGRHFYEAGPMPRALAEAWIKAQKNEYFKPGDYYLVTRTIPKGKDQSNAD